MLKFKTNIFIYVCNALGRNLNWFFLDTFWLKCLSNIFFILSFFSLDRLVLPAAIFFQNLGQDIFFSWIKSSINWLIHILLSTRHPYMHKKIILTLVFFPKFSSYIYFLFFNIFRPFLMQLLFLILYLATKKIY